MNYFSIFLVSFTIALSGALSPGPLLATVISESPRHGTKAGPLIILGHALLEIGMVALIVLGLARFVYQPFLLNLISLLVSGILIYFGIKMLVSVPALSLDITPGQSQSSNLVLMGITVSLSNPYWTIWWLTIGLGLLLAAQKAGFWAIGIFFIGHILADLLWYTLVSFGLSAGKRFLTDRLYRGIVLICAVMLLGFGLIFGLNSIRA